MKKQELLIIHNHLDYYYWCRHLLLDLSIIMSNTVGVTDETRTTYHSQSPRLLLLMSPSLGAAEETWTTYHSQSPRLLLLMSPSLGVAEETGTTYHSQPPRLLLLMSPSFIRLLYNYEYHSGCNWRNRNYLSFTIT